MRITDEYYFFWNGIYSQWYMDPNKPYLFKDADEDGQIIKFISAEHYMMYYKALTFNDIESAGLILKTVHPGDVKKIGRAIKNYDDSVWSAKRFDVVVKGNLLKFSQNRNLLKDLSKHSNLEFVEASPYDKIWGIGLAENDDRVLDKSLWDGENLLGKAINKVAKILLK